MGWRNKEEWMELEDIALVASSWACFKIRRYIALAGSRVVKSPNLISSKSRGGFGAKQTSLG